MIYYQKKKKSKPYSLSNLCCFIRPHLWSGPGAAGDWRAEILRIDKTEIRTVFETPEFSEDEAVQWEEKKSNPLSRASVGRGSVNRVTQTCVNSRSQAGWSCNEPESTWRGFRICTLGIGCTWTWNLALEAHRNEGPTFQQKRLVYDHEGVGITLDLE